MSEVAEKKGGWFSRLKAGLSRSSSKLGDGIAGIFNKRKLDDQALEDLEELLITSDLGVSHGGPADDRAGEDPLRQGRRPPGGAGSAWPNDIAGILEPVAKPLAFDPANRPQVVLVVGVNGSGKTTTIGKLASHYRGAGPFGDAWRPAIPSAPRPSNS